MSAPGRAGDGPPKASGAGITGMAGSIPPYLHSSRTQQQQPCIPLIAYSHDSRLRSLVSFLVLACVLDDFARLQPDLHRARTISAVPRVSSLDLIYCCLDDALLPRSPSCYANLV